MIDGYDIKLNPNRSPIYAISCVHEYSDDKTGAPSDIYWIIGDKTKNKIPWQSSVELKYFQKMTDKCAVIMGRSTWESLPKVLDNRLNVVVSEKLFRDIVVTKEPSSIKDPFVVGNSGQLVFRSFRLALYEISNYSAEYETLDAIFIIGGSELYRSVIQHAMIRDNLDAVFISTIKSGTVLRDTINLPKNNDGYINLLALSTFPLDSLYEWLRKYYRGKYHFVSKVNNYNSLREFDAEGYSLYDIDFFSYSPTMEKSEKAFDFTRKRVEKENPWELNRSLCDSLIQRGPFPNI